jgi:hypothetical protein
MHNESREVATPTVTKPLAEWKRPELRRIEAGMAEGSRGTGPVDLVFAS